MEWYYAKAGKQIGPVSQQQLSALGASGEITGETLVWRDGMSGWQKYETVTPPPLPTPGSGTQCSNCHKTFPEADLIRFGPQLICASCKPAFLQRFKETGALSSGNLWRSESKLVMTHDAALPDRCIKCNQPANGYRLKRKLFYHHPAIYLVLLLNILIYAIVASIAGKRATIYVGLCEAHRRKRWTGIAIGWGSFVVGLLIAIGGGMSMKEPGVPILLGISLLLVGGIAGIVISGIVRPKKIDPQYIHVAGACDEYLEGFPTWDRGG